MESKEQIKPTFTVPMEGYTATLEKGVWKYEPKNEIKKAEKVNTISKYKDPVQFKIMEEYEQESKNRYKNQLGKMVVEIVGYLGKI